LAALKVRDKAKKIAAYLLEVGEEDLEWEPGRFFVKGAPGKGKTIQEVAFAAYTNHPPFLEPGLEAVNYYDPPNLTFPFGSYICVVNIDRGTGEVHIRRFLAVDDCGTVINPMIVEGQIHGGLTQGLAPAMYEEISYDENGNIQGGNFQDYLIPTAMETPRWETDRTITPSPSGCLPRFPAHIGYGRATYCAPHSPCRARHRRRNTRGNCRQYPGSTGAGATSRNSISCKQYAISYGELA
jgi:carbon-monoxide dehydrogenase large subunit